MKTQIDSNEDAPMAKIKDLRKHLGLRIETQRTSQADLLSSLQTTFPDIIFSVDLSLKVISLFNNRPFTPTHLPPPNPSFSKRNISKKPISTCRKNSLNDYPLTEKPTIDESGNPLTVVRSMVAVCLFHMVPFTEIDSSTVLRNLQNHQSATLSEKAALRELGGESGSILAVEMALRSMAEDNGSVNLKQFDLNGKSRVMIVGIDRTRLLKELPESSQHQDCSKQSQKLAAMSNDGNANIYTKGGHFVRPMVPEMWGPLPMMVGPRGGGEPREMTGLQNLQKLAKGTNAPATGLNATMASRMKSEEVELKGLEAMLSKKSFKELQKSKTSEELLDLIHRPTAKEAAMAAKFKTKGGSQVKEYCTASTKEDCRRQSCSYTACERVHFRRIIAQHTDINLGDCSFLDTCRHMKTCKYVHYELDSAPDGPKPLKKRAEYCSAADLGEPQWISCDIRNFRMDIIGQFGVIMADPPWDIHMELPYGTMADDEMRTLNVPALQTDGLIFLWVTGRAMELGRECMELWGYKRVEEIIWVKTNQLQRIIRTGRTGHWLNHSKEHCLVGIKGDPIVNRNIDTNVLVAEVRETSRKPDEMYALLERISPGTRKLELFARTHNTHPGWMSLGNQLNGVRLVDEGLRARFKAAYPDVEVQPKSPSRVSAMEVDSLDYF